MSTGQERILSISRDHLPHLERISADRLVFDLGSLALIDSRTIARLLEIARLAGASAVRIRNACKRIVVQLTQLGLHRVLIIEAA